jgi:hypothetical protein
MTVNVTPGLTGKITYSYATSPKGGSATVYIDGVSRGTINYLGANGSTFVPVFGSSAVYGNLSPGAHTFELRNMSGTVYVDGFCLENVSTSGTSSTALGPTSSSSGTQAPGESASAFNVPATAQTISVIAEATPAVPLQIVVLSPSGSVLAVSQSASGIATLDQAVTSSGVYLVKVVNLGLGPVAIRSAATALVNR